MHSSSPESALYLRFPQRRIVVQLAMELSWLSWLSSWSWLWLWLLSMHKRDMSPPELAPAVPCCSTGRAPRRLTGILVVPRWCPGGGGGCRQQQSSPVLPCPALRQRTVLIQAQPPARPGPGSGQPNLYTRLPCNGRWTTLCTCCRGAASTHTHPPTYPHTPHPCAHDADLSSLLKCDPAYRVRGLRGVAVQGWDNTPSRAAEVR